MLSMHPASPLTQLGNISANKSSLNHDGKFAFKARGPKSWESNPHSILNYLQVCDSAKRLKMYFSPKVLIYNLRTAIIDRYMLIKHISVISSTLLEHVAFYLPTKCLHTFYLEHSIDRQPDWIKCQLVLDIMDK